MNVFIRFIIFLTISYTICVCDYNSNVQFKKRHIKEIDVLRQLINQETLIRLSLVKDVKAVVDDVSAVKKGMAFTKRMASNLQQALKKLKRQIATRSQDDTLSQKMEALGKQMDTLSQNNTLQQTVETLKKQVAILSQDDTLSQKLQTFEKQIDALSHNNTLQQTIETIKREIDFLKSDKTLQNTVESLKREVKTQKQEGRKTFENCQNMFQEYDHKFKILNENITDIYQFLNRTEVKTVEEGYKPKRDCKDHYQLGHSKTGVYNIIPIGNESRVSVFCDMETDGGGWTAIQKRVSGSVRFNRTWAEYKTGFGSPDDSYWIGNDVIHQITKGRNSSLYVSITLRNGKKLYELYNQFSVADETNKYRLFLGGPATGTLGDAMLDTARSSGDLSRMAFSTLDRDNDGYDGVNCAVCCGEGGGWWYNYCHYANLTGQWSPANWNNPWSPTVMTSGQIKETLMMIKPN